MMLMMLLLLMMWRAGLILRPRYIRLCKQLAFVVIVLVGGFKGRRGVRIASLGLVRFGE
jgi:hypothetical protein